MALPQKKQQKSDATAARLSALNLPEGGAWAREARGAAKARVEAMGLPHPRDEYWKYTRPETLVAPQAPKAATFAPYESAVFGDIDRVNLVFVDGVFDPARSDDPAIGGVEIEPLAGVAAKDIHWARDLYGVLEARGQAPVERPLAALNTAYATEGVVIRVTGKAAKPVNLSYLQEALDTDVMIHNLVKVEAGADLTLLENGPAAGRLSKVLEVEVADGGAFHHVRTQGRAHERRAATHIFARLGKESTFKSFTLTVNGALTRNEAVIEFTGDDAVAHVAGACLGDGKDFHHDDTVFITHDAVNCESRQVFKKVLRNGAVGVFQGKILVTPVAQKTDGYQISQSLLLDEDSQFLAKPELEIYADDVACSHGSTSGAIDEEGLFYLRSRGVPKAEATDLMVIAFVAEALEEIEDPVIAADVLSRLEGWLHRRRNG
ncbi:SufD family Fe-S cluster assembly protein [Tropicimonas sp. IMCC6043]|uniref:SufB/SufD family protein n=1 Tax=Tropicimonas sp. IMCC6043 TaxID=2510645 RepID=UPI00101CFB47|nr:SufD family Fe-S cluster assembly protein [Tropicimonas sp. IMCC6043]RYH10519.1 SufD family Fe-S cluster assembly protein [Tropicimonas sp. IMCC6043]